MPDGRVRVDALLTRTGVFTYRNADGSVRREYRPPEEVFHQDSLDSAEGAVVTDDHPPMMITGDNATLWARGAVLGVPHREGDHVAGTLSIYDGGTVSKMDKGKQEVSCGYQCEIDATPGIAPNGERYDVVQRIIRYNHVAVVEHGRAGTARVRMDGAMVQVADAALNAAARHALPGRDFAVPAREGLPIQDAEHLRAAMARFNQYQFKDAAEKQTAYRKIVAKAKSLGVDSTNFQKEFSGRNDVDSGRETITMADENLAATAAGQVAAATERAASLQIRLDAETARVNELAGEVTALKAQVTKLEKERADAPDVAELQDTITKLTGDCQALKERCDRAEDPERIREGVRARMDLERIASTLSPGNRYDDLSDKQLLQTLHERLLGVVPEGSDDNYLRAAVKTAARFHVAGEAAIAKLRADAKQNTQTQTVTDSRSARQAMIARNRNIGRATGA